MTRSNRILVTVFATLVFGSMLLAGVFAYFVNGKDLQLVVTLRQPATQPAREGLKQDCGALPGIRVVPDRGNPDPRVQGRFPVRFSIKDASYSQQSALEACLNRHPEVLGFLSEGDR